MSDSECTEELAEMRTNSSSTDPGVGKGAGSSKQSTSTCDTRHLEFEFDRWATSCNLKRKTTALLVKEDLNTEETLSAVSFEDLTRIGVSVGQAILIHKSFKSALTPTVPAGSDQTTLSDQMSGSQSPASEQLASSVTLKDIKRQANSLQEAGKTFNDLISSNKSASVEVVNKVPLTLGLSDTDSPAVSLPLNKTMNTCQFVDCVSAAHSPLTTLTLRSSTRKAYHITKYLTEEAKNRIKNKRKDLILTRMDESDDRLVVRTEEAHPYAGISLEDWGAANCRLMYAMITEGALSQTEIPFYLSYTTTIFDFVAKYDWHSILDYDYQYRERQAQHGFKWGSLNPNAQIQLLPRQKNQLPSTNQTTYNRGYRQRLRHSNELCKQWLARGECRFGNRCRYVHQKIHTNLENNYNATQENQSKNLSGSVAPQNQMRNPGSTWTGR